MVYYFIILEEFVVKQNIIGPKQWLPVYRCPMYKGEHFTEVVPVRVRNYLHKRYTYPFMYNV